MARCSHLQAPGAHHAALLVQCRSSCASVPRLTAPQLLHAAKLAKLSGACYLPDDQLQGFLMDQNLKLHAAGNTHFTRHAFISVLVINLFAGNALSISSLVPDLIPYPRTYARVL